MSRQFAAVAALAGLLIAAGGGLAEAQKAGGILQMLDFASPASMSIHEESTITAGIPMMGVFNNLVVVRSARARRTACHRSCPIWRPNGAGARTARS